MNKDSALSIAMAFIKKWEGLGWKTPSGGTYSYTNADSLPADTKLYAYPDGNSYSIGWGTYNQLPSDGTLIKSNTSITKEMADDEFRTEVSDKIMPVLDQYITAPLNEYQYAALISFGYNAGPEAIKFNNLIDAVNNGGDVVGILKKTAITEKSTGKVSNALINRRKDEASLYSGNYNDLYSYYLRNSNSINYAVIGLVMIALTGYVYYLKKKKVF
jgi:LPXTG-motif cell wall-anchored protein